MSEIDGLEVIEVLKKESPEVKIIAMTGDSVSTNYLAIAKVLGAGHTFYKPFDRNEFLTVVESMVLL